LALQFFFTSGSKCNRSQFSTVSFPALDEVIDEYFMLKRFKTSGDSYIAASGIPYSERQTVLQTLHFFAPSYAENSCGIQRGNIMQISKVRNRHSLRTGCSRRYWEEKIHL